MLFVTALAAAASPAWSWSRGETHRWLVESSVQSPYVMWLIEERNASARVGWYSMAATVACRTKTVLPKGKGFILRCKTEDASLYARAIVGDEGQVGGALKDYEHALENHAFSLKITPQGRISQVHLDLPDTPRPRTKYIHDMLDRYLALALVPLDVQLPREGAVVGDVWAQKNFRGGQFPVEASLMANLKTRNQLADQNGTPVVHSATEGAISYGADAWDFRSQGAIAVVDGDLDSAILQLRTANKSATTQGSLPFAVNGAIRALEEGEQPQLLPSQEL